MVCNLLALTRTIGERRESGCYTDLEHDADTLLAASCLEPRCQPIWSRDTALVSPRPSDHRSISPSHQQVERVDGEWHQRLPPLVKGVIISKLTAIPGV